MLLMLTSILRASSALLFPPACEICSVPLGLQRQALCQSCESKIRVLQAPFCVSCGRNCLAENKTCGNCAGDFYFDRVFAYAYYEGVMREILHHYKFNEKKYVAEYLSEKMISFFKAHLKVNDFDAVLAVPLDPFGHNKRGFNQSALLTRRISKALSLEDRSYVLRRKRPLSPQFLMNKSERKENVRGQFWIAAPESVRKARCLVVDDILTTGETLSECARVLKEAGAISVTGLTASRGL